MDIPYELRVLLIRLGFEMVRLLNWSTAIKLDTSYLTTSDLEDNHQTILAVLIQQKTLLEAFKQDFVVLNTRCLNAHQNASISIISQGTVGDNQERKYSIRDRLPRTALDRINRIFASIPDSATGGSYSELVHHGCKESLTKLCSALLENNDNLRRLMSSTVQRLQDQDEESNLELLQLHISAEELAELEEAVGSKTGQGTQLSSRGLTTTMLDENVVGVASKEALAQFARFKAFNSQIAQSQNAQSSEIDKEPPITKSKIQILGADAQSDESPSSRVQGYFRTKYDTLIPIWVEWKDFESQLNQVQPNSHTQRRIQELTLLLKDRKKPRAFRAPDCLGYFEDKDVQNGSKTGLVFEIPSTVHSSVEPVSLYHLFGKINVPSTSERISLAHAVSSCLLYLHAADWLHKGFSSHAVIFFREGKGAVDIRKPFLSGFDFSRPARNSEMTVRPSQNPVADAYRHPEVQSSTSRGSFKRSYDLYSLGLILLEIAHWKPIHRVLGYQEINDMSSRTTYRVRQTLLDGGEALEALRLLGEAYLEIARTCLTGAEAFNIKPGEDENEPTVAARLQSAFFNNVVRTLRRMQSDAVQPPISIAKRRSEKQLYMPVVSKMACPFHKHTPMKHQGCAHLAFSALSTLKYVD